MYDVHSLQDTITKLNTLRGFLSELDRDNYNHNVWSDYCGSPSCALGWATTLWPEDLRLAGTGLHSIVIYKPLGSTNIKAASHHFGLDYTIATYLFDNVCYHNETAKTILPRGYDESSYLTIERLNRVEQYLRRKLAILTVEENKDNWQEKKKVINPCC